MLEKNDSWILFRIKDTMDRIRNPLTGRLITVGGKVYNGLVKKGIIIGENVSITEKKKSLPKEEIPEKSFSIGNYIFNLSDILELILPYFENKDLWKIRRINKLTREISLELITKRISNVSIKNLPKNLDEVATEICRTQGVAKLEFFAKLVSNGITPSMRFLISSVNSKLYWDQNFPQTQNRELLMLYIKYNPTSIYGLEYYVKDKDILMHAFRYGVNPLKVLEIAIKLGIDDESYLKILNSCKQCFDVDIFKIDRKEVKALMDKNGLILN